jgi:hypothetical protein
MPFNRSHHGRRNRPPTPKFWQVPFFREQSALFLREKCLKDCLFLPKGHF